MAESAVDIETLEALKELMGEDFPFLLGRFLEESSRLGLKLKEAVEAGHLADIEKSAHSLKSCVASVGASKLQEMLEEMETGARAGKPADYQRLSGEVQQSLQEVQETIAGNVQ